MNKEATENRRRTAFDRRGAEHAEESNNILGTTRGARGAGMTAEATYGRRPAYANPGCVEPASPGRLPRPGEAASAYSVISLFMLFRRLLTPRTLPHLRTRAWPDQRPPTYLPSPDLKPRRPTVDLTFQSTTTLNDGNVIPTLGLGVFQSEPGDETRQAVLWALEAGYRHIDTAAAYRNEESVGRALEESGIARDDVFITTKLWNDDQGYDSALRAMDRSLERLGLDHVDLYLIHWPEQEKRLESWRALERIREEGKATSIGVSNYLVRHLEELFANSDAVPAVNQIELSPYNLGTRADTVALCRERGIALEAYSPLTKARKLDDPPLVEIAERHGVSTARILVRWSLQHGFICIPKSVHRDRIQENRDVYGFALSDAEMETLDGLDEGLATGWDPSDWP